MASKGAPGPGKSMKTVSRYEEFRSRKKLEPKYGPGDGRSVLDIDSIVVKISKFLGEVQWLERARMVLSSVLSRSTMIA